MSPVVHTVLNRMSTAYIIESDAGLFLVDAGLPTDFSRIDGCLREIGRNDLRLIFITHAHLDHYGCANALRRTYGAPIAVHHEDAPIMARGGTPVGSVRGRGRLIRHLLPVARWLWKLEPTPPDILLEDNASLKALGIDATVVHTPGHTPGSSCLIVDERMAFAGDLVSTNGGAHVQRYFAHDWEELGNSLARIQRLGLERVYPGHGVVPMSGPELDGLEWQQSEK